MRPLNSVTTAKGTLSACSATLQVSSFLCVVLALIHDPSLLLASATAIDNLDGNAAPLVADGRDSSSPRLSNRQKSVLFGAAAAANSGSNGGNSFISNFTDAENVDNGEGLTVALVAVGAGLLVGIMLFCWCRICLRKDREEMAFFDTDDDEDDDDEADESRSRDFSDVARDKRKSQMQYEQWLKDQQKQQQGEDDQTANSGAEVNGRSEEGNGVDGAGHTEVHQGHQPPQSTMLLQRPPPSGGRSNNNTNNTTTNRTAEQLVDELDVSAELAAAEAAELAAYEHQTLNQQQDEEENDPNGASGRRSGGGIGGSRGSNATTPTTLAAVGGVGSGGFYYNHSEIAVPPAANGASLRQQPPTEANPLMSPSRGVGGGGGGGYTPQTANGGRKAAGSVGESSRPPSNYQPLLPEHEAPLLSPAHYSTHYNESDVNNSGSNGPTPHGMPAGSGVCRQGATASNTSPSLGLSALTYIPPPNNIHTSAAVQQQNAGRERATSGGSRGTPGGAGAGGSDGYPTPTISTSNTPARGGGNISGAAPSFHSMGVGGPAAGLPAAQTAFQPDPFSSANTAKPHTDKSAPPPPPSTIPPKRLPQTTGLLVPQKLELDDPDL